MTKTISIHTVAKDAIRLDYHLECMLKHHVQFADEVIVMEGYSSDGTFERIKDIDPKIKIVRKRWNATDSYLDFVELGRKECSGDWCLKLDADEFLPEWEWDRLRKYIDSTEDAVAAIHLKNFYGSYEVFHKDPGKLRWPEFKWCIHPNTEKYEFWGDASNVHEIGEDANACRTGDNFEVHHFGTVRHAARLREKWRTQSIRNQKHSGKYDDIRKIRMLPKWLFDLLPHNWLDEDIIGDLGVYEGPFMEVVVDNPHEFTRDKNKVRRYLEAHLSYGLMASPDQSNSKDDDEK
ncbi:Glycosyl transferase family 2 [Rubripirellula amarantea]|uniref:Glycosyl transferase family 2 n=1 Tax=Rubripirellula amarantea TaxID=2527999 RepID=A0A5C5WXS4_9BACT|nr:glycosyltransferase family 2 protein [Rubripirellula amarantea]TWT54672.1 Glycosyl transferase family 2 [Rubripirellula amarantea]